MRTGYLNSNVCKTDETMSQVNDSKAFRLFLDCRVVQSYVLAATMFVSRPTALLAALTAFVVALPPGQFVHYPLLMDENTFRSVCSNPLHY
ncbi:hypothetical protein KIN20_018461 [Parelaphostrongylus tenuis]|uniref:Uncharacterized protein n=1 Tax=Parelaphostrongylus tenuis TaxID=148309 RepID=A0AAD5MN26_PARTN|nr:hypothetical protein KIN20_018461 [Parelaphostrongylus tenuis]